MSLSNNYPNAIPSLVLDFANTKKLDPRITFTRASTATFYDGKTVAKAEENLVQRSDDFTVAGWIKSAGVVSANTTTAPDGTTTAETFTANSGTVAPYISSDFGPGMSANTQATHSIFVKKNTHDFVQVWVHNGGANSYANFDVNTGVTGNAGAGVTNHTITSVGNGWYRCSMTFTATSTSLGVGVAIVGSTTATRLQTFSAAGTESIYIWGAQTEARGFLTAYTPTTTAPITNYIPALQTAASGVARFEHNPVTGESLGLEIEEQRTNLLLQSQFASGYTTVRMTINSNVAIAPDGTLTASKFIPTSTSGSHALYRAVTVTSGSAHTWSGYFKAGEYNTIHLNFQASSSIYIVKFDLVNGTSTNVSGTGTATITSVGNGWYRCTATATTASTSGFWQFDIYDNSGNTSYAGNDWNGVYAWGAQVEAGSFATSYIKTEGSQVTRSADSATMTGTNFSSWYRADEGSFYADVTPNSADQLMYVLIANTTTFNNANYIGKFNASGGSAGKRWAAGTNLGSTAQAFIATGTDVAVSASKLVYSYKTNDFQFTNSGSSVGSDTLGQVPNPTSFWIGSRDGTLNLGGTIAKIAYYPLRLTNAELAGLTTV